ncbi:MAG: hypothetical protein AAF488_19505, partial [Planctomycetota bacterium]
MTVDSTVPADRQETTLDAPEVEWPEWPSRVEALLARGFAAATGVDLRAGRPVRAGVDVTPSEGVLVIAVIADPVQGSVRCWFRGENCAPSELAGRLSSAVQQFGQFEESVEASGPRVSLLQVILAVEAEVDSSSLLGIYGACQEAGVRRVRIAVVGEDPAPDRETSDSELSSKELQACVVVLKRQPEETVCTVAGRRITTEVGEFEESKGLVPAPRRSEIEGELRRLKESYRGPGENGLPVVIDFGPDVPWKYVVDVLNVCHRVGIKEISF